jgi:MFS family permease
MFKIKYFNNHLSQGFTALFSGRMMMFIGNGFLGLFLPIFFLTKFGYNIGYVFLYYLIGYLAYAIALPWGARILNKVGLRRSLRISVFFNAAVYLCLFLLDYNLWFFIILSAILLTFYRVTFWYPFHLDFAKFTDLKDRGKNVSLIWATQSLLSVVMPVLSGVLIGHWGFDFIFIIAIILFLSAFIPFLALPRTKERFLWSYIETFKKFFHKNNRKLIIANMANGAENTVAVVIWPIFIWQLLQGNYFQVGAVSSLIVLVAVILQLIVGKYTDLFNKRKMIHWGSIFYAAGWIVKIFVLTAYQIFWAGAYHNLAKIFKDTPFDALNYELMADQGHYIDEYTVLKEVAVNFGKTLILAFAILVALSFGINWTFILAALASLFINLL